MKPSLNGKYNLRMLLDSEDLTDQSINQSKTSVVYQGLFCHDQVSSGEFLAFFNFWRNLQMFLDTIKPKTENQNSNSEKNDLIMWAQIRGIIA